jgi:hypothetical protein
VAAGRELTRPGDDFAGFGTNGPLARPRALRPCARPGRAGVMARGILPTFAAAGAAAALLASVASRQARCPAPWSPWARRRCGCAWAGDGGRVPGRRGGCRCPRGHRVRRPVDGGRLRYRWLPDVLTCRRIRSSTWCSGSRRWPVPGPGSTCGRPVEPWCPTLLVHSLSPGSLGAVDITLAGAPDAGFRAEVGGPRGRAGRRRRAHQEPGHDEPAGVAACRTGRGHWRATRLMSGNGRAGGDGRLTPVTGDVTGSSGVALDNRW